MSISPFEADEGAPIGVLPAIDTVPDESGTQIAELLASAELLADVARRLFYLGNPSMAQTCRAQAEANRRAAAQQVRAH